MSFPTDVFTLKKRFFEKSRCQKCKYSLTMARVLANSEEAVTSTLSAPSLHPMRTGMTRVLIGCSCCANRVQELACR